MALVECKFKSRILQMSTEMTVILPESSSESANSEKKYPTLYLLHGMSGDHSLWSRSYPLERFVSNYEVAVVMPAFYRSYYTDMAYGNKYWTFLSEELIQTARHFFPLSHQRGENFVAGQSMGGYGAFKLALRCPEIFGYAGSLAGNMDPECLIGLNKVPEAEFNLIFGSIDQYRNSDNHLSYLLIKVVREGKKLPKLYQTIGTEDFLYGVNQRFLDLGRSLDLDIEYSEGPGGHEWEYWNRITPQFLEWLPLKRINS